MRDQDKLSIAQKKWYRNVVCSRRRQWLKENGPCVECGSWERLEVDHRDPRTKTSHNIWSWSDAKRIAELAKCQVLCRSCHKRKSANECRANMKGKPNTWCRILTPEQVREIRRLTASGMSNGKVAKQFGIGRTTVNDVRVRRSYSEIT